MGYKVDTQISMLLASLLLITTFPPSVSEPPTPPPSDYYSECSKPYHCGGLHNISYPFWGTNRPRYCGGVPFELNCEAEADDGSGYHREHTYIKMGSQYFNVVDINPKNYTMKLVPLEEADVCLAGFKFSLSSPLMYNQSVHNITLLYKDEDNCPTYVPVPVYNLGCPDSENVVYCNNTEEDEVLKQHPELKSCHPVQVPAEAVRLLHSDTDLPPYFGKGFVVNYTLSQECLNCMIAGGLCGSHYTNPNQFACYYPHKSMSPNSPLFSISHPHAALMHSSYESAVLHPSFCHACLTLDFIMQQFNVRNHFIMLNPLLAAAIRNLILNKTEALIEKLTILRLMKFQR